MVTLKVLDTIEEACEGLNSNLFQVIPMIHYIQEVFFTHGQMEIKERKRIIQILHEQCIS